LKRLGVNPKSKQGQLFSKSIKNKLHFSSDDEQENNKQYPVKRKKSVHWDRPLSQTMESPPTSPGFSASASDLLNICDTPEALFDANDKGRSGIPVSSPSSSTNAASFSSIDHSGLVSSQSTAERIQARGPSHDLATSLANPASTSSVHTSTSSSTSSSPNSLSDSDLKLKIKT